MWKVLKFIFKTCFFNSVNIVTPTDNVQGLDILAHCKATESPPILPLLSVYSVLPPSQISYIINPCSSQLLIVRCFLVRSCIQALFCTGRSTL